MTKKTITENGINYLVIDSDSEEEIEVPSTNLDKLELLLLAIKDNDNIEHKKIDRKNILNKKKIAHIYNTISAIKFNLREHIPPSFINTDLNEFNKLTQKERRLIQACIHSINTAYLDQLNNQLTILNKKLIINKTKIFPETITKINFREWNNTNRYIKKPLSFDTHKGIFKKQ